MPKEVEEFDEKFIQEIVQARQNGSKWGEIAEAHGISEGKAQLVYMWGTEKAVPPAKRIAETVIELRNAKGLSWGRIAAMFRWPEGRVKSTYAENVKPKDAVARIGKGGRYSDPDGTAKPVKATAKKATAPVKGAIKKATAKTTPMGEPVAKGVKGKKVGFTNMDFDQLKAAIELRTIQVGRTDGSRSEQIKVKSVQKLENGVVTLSDATNGGSRAIKVPNILRVSDRQTVPSTKAQAEAKKSQAAAKKAAPAPAAAPVKKATKATKKAAASS